MREALHGKTVVVVGQGGGIARAVAILARSEGARVVVAGRDKARLAAAYRDTDITAEFVDLTDDSSIAALAERLGLVHQVVSAVSARTRGRLGQLERVALPWAAEYTLKNASTHQCAAAGSEWDALSTSSRANSCDRPINGHERRTHTG